MGFDKLARIPVLIGGMRPPVYRGPASGRPGPIQGNHAPIRNYSAYQALTRQERSYHAEPTPDPDLARVQATTKGFYEQILSSVGEVEGSLTSARIEADPDVHIEIRKTHIDAITRTVAAATAELKALRNSENAEAIDDSIEIIQHFGKGTINGFNRMVDDLRKLGARQEKTARSTPGEREMEEPARRFRDSVKQRWGFYEGIPEFGGGGGGGGEKKGSPPPPPEPTYDPELLDLIARRCMKALNREVNRVAAETTIYSQNYAHRPPKELAKLGDPTEKQAEMVGDLAKAEAKFKLCVGAVSAKQVKTLAPKDGAYLKAYVIDKLIDIALEHCTLVRKEIRQTFQLLKKGVDWRKRLNPEL